MSQEKVTTMSDLLASASKVSSAAGLYALLVSGSGIISALNGMNILPLFPKTVDTDLDSFTENGIFLIGNECPNSPVQGNGKVLLNLRTFGIYIYQVVLRAGAGGVIYYRAKGDNGWCAWKKVVFEPA